MTSNTLINFKYKIPEIRKYSTHPYPYVDNQHRAMPLDKVKNELFFNQKELIEKINKGIIDEIDIQRTFIIFINFIEELYVIIAKYQNC